MARANPAVRKLLADVVAPVVEAKGGAPKVAPKVARHRATVTRWAKGEIDWDGLAALASGTRTDIVITFPAHGHPKVNAKEPLEPAWLEGLAGDIAEKVTARLTASRADELRQLIDDLEQRLRQRS